MNIRSDVWAQLVVPPRFKAMLETQCLGSCDVAFGSANAITSTYPRFDLGAQGHLIFLLQS